MLTTSTDANLIKALFAAAMNSGDDTAASGSWTAFLTQLQDATGAQSASLQLESPPDQPRIWALGPIAQLDAVQILQMRNDRVYSQIDLPQAQPAQSPVRAIKCATGSGAAALTIWHPTREFRAVDGSRLSALTPFLGQACASWHAASAARQRALRTQSLCRNLKAGWLMLNAAGTVLWVDPNARALLNTSAEFRAQAGGRLDFADPQTALAFRRGFSAVATAQSPRALIELSHNPLIQMILKPDLWNDTPVITAILRHELQAQDLDPKTITNLLGLSPSEARLAVLICDGYCLSDAAAFLGWTIETTRSCSKKVYAKTRVSGQTGLVRKMLNSALWGTI